MKYVLFFLFATAVIFFAYRVRSSSVSNIDATVKISICGNFIKEGGEQCDNDDLNGQSCESLGYTYGTLSCDFACDFDTSECVLVPTPTPTITPTPTVTPTPTLTLTPTPTLTPTVTPTPTTGQTSASSPSSAAPTSTPGITEVATEVISKYYLPSQLNIFDIDSNGKLDSEELYNSIKKWVGFWKEEKNVEMCDINTDDMCDLRDFSILLYNVDR